VPRSGVEEISGPGGIPWPVRLPSKGPDKVELEEDPSRINKPDGRCIVSFIYLRVSSTAKL
jgi:hypothetical protein